MRMCLLVLVFLLLGKNLKSQSCNQLSMYATPCYVNGNSQAGGNSGSQDAFVIFESTNFGENTAPQKHIVASQLGTVWGVAYNQLNSKLYTSSFLKRHASLGPAGIGAIYQIDPNAASPTASLLVDLTSLGINVGTDPRTVTSGIVDNPNELPDNTSGPSWDVAAFDLVGKTSLGGMDVTDDGKKMFVMNLQTKSLIELSLSANSATLLGNYPIPNPNCSNGDYRPWAVKYYKGKVYVGVVCSAETSQLASDLKATIYEFDGTNFNSVYNFDLNYPRGIAGGAGGILTDPAEWLPWTNTFQSISASFVSAGTIIYPQPILSDIEFDIDGSMIVALMDRTGHQTGNANYSTDTGDTKPYFGQIAGDILRIGWVNNAYQLENNGQINGIQAEVNGCYGGKLNGFNNGQGPGNGEYYWSDHFSYNPCNLDPNAGAAGVHQEISFGGLAFTPGSGEIAMTSMDPTSTASSGGLTWHNNLTGQRRFDYSNPYDLTNHGYRIYSAALAGNFAKAIGLGDLDAFCTSACVIPSDYTFAQNIATCTSTTANNDGILTLEAVTGATHFGISSLNAQNYDGPILTSLATTITLPQTIQGSIPNTGGTYIVRLFSGLDACFIDVPVVINPVSCKGCPTNNCLSIKLNRN